MTDKTRAAMQQALEALEELHYSSGTVVAVRKYERATAALREALEQPDWEAIGKEQLRRYEEKFGALPQPVSQEPVLRECRHCGWLCKPNHNESKKWYPLEQPVKEVELTDAVVNAARNAMNGSVEALDGEGSIKIPSHLAAPLSLRLDELDRTVIAKYKEKNK